MNLLIFLFMNAIMPGHLQISSPDFKANEYIPAKYSCEGKSVNPAISIKDIPAGTKSLALILDDPDAGQAGFNHWTMWNMEPGPVIDEDSGPGIQGKNGKGANGYIGPCPPSGIHHYHFKVYALDKKLDLESSAGKSDLEKAMKGHILATGELVGLYKKSGQ